MFTPPSEICIAFKLVLIKNNLTKTNITDMLKNINFLFKVLFLYFSKKVYKRKINILKLLSIMGNLVL